MSTPSDRRSQRRLATRQGICNAATRLFHLARLRSGDRGRDCHSRRCRTNDGVQPDMFAPRPSAKVRTATEVNIGARRRRRSAERKSCQRFDIASPRRLDVATVASFTCRACGNSCKRGPAHIYQGTRQGTCSQEACSRIPIASRKYLLLASRKRVWGAVSDFDRALRVARLNSKQD